MFYKKFFFLTAVLCMFKVAYTQTPPITIFGYVHDIDNNPIEMVNIIIENSNHGTASDTNGIFKLMVSKKNIKLVLSHVSYKKQELKITKSDLEKAAETGIFTLDIQMESNIKTLPTVSINNSKIEMVYRNKKAWVLDYELTDNYMILLLLEGNKKILRIVEENNENNYIEKEVSKDILKLYKDSFGSLHLITKDTVYQAFFFESEIIIPYSTTTQVFNKLIKPIQISIENKLVFQKFSDYNQRVTYMLIDTEKKTEKELTSVINKEASHFNKSLFEDIHKNKRQSNNFDSFSNNMEIEDEDAFNLLLEQKNSANLHFFFHIFGKPTYQPVKYINQKIYLFNHYDGKLLAFDEEGNTLSENPIIYQNDKRQWKNEIIVNEEKTRCFAKYIKDALVTLYEIDLNTGRIKGSVTLEEHAFPEKIRIKGNFIYYIHKEHLYSDDNKRYLWKQPLPE